MFYDINGEPMTAEQWQWTFADFSSTRQVVSTRIGPFAISTVWLGMDHSFGHGKPLIFETMVFHDVEEEEEEEREDSAAYRWHTLEEAHVGHNEIVTLVLSTHDGLENSTLTAEQVAQYLTTN